MEPLQTGIPTALWMPIFLNIYLILPNITENLQSSGSVAKRTRM